MSTGTVLTPQSLAEELKNSDMEPVAFEETLVGLAMLAEKAERYDDMCFYLKELVVSKTGRQETLVEEERNLLSVAFKNVVGALRSSWRTFQNSEDTVIDATLVTKYSKRIETELENKCLEVLDILSNKLVPSVEGQNDECEVFYLKMCGDYFRYLAEFCDNPSYKDQARDNYTKALDVAQGCLTETHPTRLGLALNFSVCYYEILKEPQQACELAKRAFDQAIQKLDTLNDANYKDSTLIMQLLRDNLTLWTAERDEHGNRED